MGHAAPPSARTLEKILFLVRDEGTPCNSHTWRIWPSGTSFYLKSKDPEMDEMKMSVHGPRPDVTGPGPWLKVGRDSSVKEPRTGAAGRGNLPIWFGGRQMTRDVKHVIRFRFDWTMFHSKVPSGKNPGDVTRPDRTQAGFVQRAPRLGHAIDVDLYLCERRPYWPNEDQARAANGLLGPIKNKAGQYLTGEVHERALLTTPTPERFRAPLVDPGDPVVRGVGMGLDDSDVLWVNEVALSRIVLLAVDRREKQEGGDDFDGHAELAALGEPLRVPEAFDRRLATCDQQGTFEGWLARQVPRDRGF